MTEALALGTALLWGASDFAGGYLSKKNHYLAVAFWRGLVQCAMYLAVALVVAGDPKFSDFLWGASAGLMGAAVLPLFFKALAEGQMGVVAPVSGVVTAAFPVVIGVALGERPSAIQIIGIFIALAAIALVSATTGDPMKTGKPQPSTWRSRMFRYDVRIAALCGIGFGGFLTVLHQTSHDSGMWPNLTSTATATILYPIVAGLSKKSLRLADPRWDLIALLALIEALAGISYIAATRSGLLSIVGVLSSMYPISTVLLACVLLRERLSRIHVAGLGAAVLSLAMIGAG